MSQSTLSPAPMALDDEARRQNAVTLALFLFAAIAFVTRIVISPQLLNRVVDYTAEGGSLFEKFHVGTYGVLLLLPVVLISRPIRLWGLEIAKFRALIRFAFILVALSAYLFAIGRGGSAAFLLDTYLTGAAAGLIALALGQESRRALGDVVLWVLIASAVIGIAEATLQQRFLPYDSVELSFRPLGLSEHPLALGALSATAIGFVALTNWRLWLRVLAILVLFLGCAASGARFALLIAAVEVIALLLLTPWPRLSSRAERRAKLAALMLTLGFGVLMVGALAASGLLSRFGDSLFDASGMARITIYQAFQYATFQQILFGMSGDQLLAIVNDKLGLQFIESTPVFLILIFGAIAALIFTVATVAMLRRLLAGAAMPAVIATITYVVISLSNNALSTKTPEMLILTVLILASATAAPTVNEQA